MNLRIGSRVQGFGSRVLEFRAGESKYGMILKLQSLHTPKRKFMSAPAIRAAL